MSGCRCAHCAKRQQHQQNAKETSYFIIKVLAVK